LSEYWKTNARIIDATGEDYRAEIKGTTAGLIIGDRALKQRLKSTYKYDLGEAWKAHTGLPFAFAAWVSNKKLPLDFITAFNDANEYGLQHLEEVINENASGSDFFDLDQYYKKHISYLFDDQKRKALDLFLAMI
jgi:chorismate dehydratase